MKIYWAAPFFDHAWLGYNAECVRTLREDGFEVVLPQEFTFNSERAEPTAVEVFRNDLDELRRSDVLIAAIDGETIDSGVAAEAGLAYAYRIPVVGLYTDLRQSRALEGRSYKNLFVIGLLRDSAGVVSAAGDVTAILREMRDGLRTRV